MDSTRIHLQRPEYPDAASIYVECSAPGSNDVWLNVTMRGCSVGRFLSAQQAREVAQALLMHADEATPRAIQPLPKPQPTVEQLRTRLAEVQRDIDPMAEYSDDHGVWSASRAAQAEAEALEDRIKQMEAA